MADIVDNRTPGFYIPSPSPTPKSLTQEQFAGQTPKSTFFPTYFQDAFGTPIEPTRTPALTPQLPAEAVPERPPHFGGLGIALDDPKFHVNHLVSSRLPLPPVEPSRRLSSSPGPPAAGSPPVGTAASTAASSKALAAAVMDSFQIQTPPPTRQASSRREVQSAKLATPYGVPANHIATPQTAQVDSHGFFFGQQTPMQFPQLQFTPEVAHFPTEAPATAPVFPQARLFWDTDNASANAMELDQHLGAALDPFTAPTPNDVNFGWPTPIPEMNVPNMANSFNSFNSGSTARHGGSPTKTTDFWPTTTGNTPSISQPSVNESFLPGTGVDPSLLFSFSQPSDIALFAEPGSHSLETSFEHTQWQPNEQQQLHTTRQRQEFDVAQRLPQLNQRPNGVPGAASNGPRPGLGRSNTDSGARRRPVSVHAQSMTSIAEGSVSTTTTAPIQRRSSPLKRLSQTSLHSISESQVPRKRTSVVLTIDANGRARTETKIIDDDVTLSRRNSRIWDQDSDSDSDMALDIIDRPASRGLTRSARISRTNSYGRLARSAVPRSASAASKRGSFAMGRSFTGGIDEDYSPTKSFSDKNPRRQTMSSFSGFSLNQMDPGEESEDTGDAHTALRKAMEDRLRKREQNNPQSRLDSHNKRWARASAEILKPTLASNQRYSADEYGIIPDSISPTSVTDPELATPTDSTTSDSSSTRCICNMAQDHDSQLMIQCESCTKWLHVRCLGMNPDKLPRVYLCIFCTGQTPLARNGRIRDPLRAPPNFNSPLVYKNNSMRR